MMISWNPGHGHVTSATEELMDGIATLTLYQPMKANAIMVSHNPTRIYMDVLIPVAIRSPCVTRTKYYSHSMKVHID